jgi:GTP cyclohydrolase I
MDRPKIAEGVRLILEGIGEDPSREGLRDTPRRVADMYAEIFAGIGEDAGEHHSSPCASITSCRSWGGRMSPTSPARTGGSAA